MLFNRNLIKYEIRNILGNPFADFFGVVFPVLMLFLITKATAGDLPADMVPTMNTAVFISMSMIIPMAVILLGYTATYSQELEKDIPIRMRLFGYSDRALLVAKIIAQFIAMTLGLLLYGVVAVVGLELVTPKPLALLGLVLCLYLLGFLFFALGHGTATIFKKFGPTYCLMMLLYFGFMFLCGMMGIRTEQLPVFLRTIAKLLPMSYISGDFIDFWQGGSYNLVPLIQAFLFLGAVSGIVLIYALYRERRVIK